MKCKYLYNGNVDSRKLITDWYSLGAHLAIKPNILSWVLHERGSMQTRIRLGERTVYKSGRYLRYVQNRIMAMLENVYEGMNDTECSLAYRKNLSAQEKITALPHAEMLITFDIRKYYDHITLAHIEHALKKCGFPTLGGRLVGRYCVVTRKDQHTLQQGSPASPVLSNIVGHFAFDQPIQRWIQHNYSELPCTYVRYCDNIALFVHSQPPEEFTEKLKEYVKQELKNRGFKTHKWNCISDTNPYKHQKFLGIVLNSQARAEIAVVDRIRAMLFNWCVQGTEYTIHRFIKEKGLKYQYEVKELLVHQLKLYFNGHINYIKRINAKQGTMLEKLYKAAVMLDERGIMITDNIFAVIKTYRNHDESVDEYLEKLMGCNAA